MRHRAGFVLLAGIAAASGGCDVPTDGSEALAVRFAEPAVRMIIGESRSNRVNFVGSAGLDAGDVDFASLDPEVIQVDDRGTVTALSTGQGRVVASLRAFEKATRDTLEVEVIANLTFEEIDAVEVAWGQLLTVRGQALDPRDLESLSVGGRPVRIDGWEPASGGPGSLEELRFRVPVGARPLSSLVALHRTGATENRPLRVDQGDIHEPNDEQPTLLDDLVGLDNSDLSFERGSGYDWYRFRNLDDDFTLEVQLRLPLQIVYGDVIIAAATASRDLEPEWTVSSGLDLKCNGLDVPNRAAFYQDDDATEDWLVLPFDSEGMDSVDVVIRTYSPPTGDLRYQLRVREGYEAAVPRDAFEPNNHCGQAAPLPTGTVTLSGDAQNDFDWFHFTVDEPTRFRASLICQQCTEFPAFAVVELFRDARVGTESDPGDLPALGSDFANPGVPAVVEAVLEPGRYFLLTYNSFLTPARAMVLSTSLTPAGN